MSNGFLSQDEINSLLNGELNNDNEVENNEELLSDLEKDLLGEVGNISMGSASTALYQLLNQKVNITTPVVTVTTIKQIKENFDVPNIILDVEYVEGISGRNMLMMKISDAAVIANCMMGGDGKIESDELSEIEISAVQEAMNQMIGSAATSMATMFGRRVDISPPQSTLWESKEQSLSNDIEEEEKVVRISFDLEVGDVLKSSIMQILPLNTAKKIVSIMMGENQVQASAETFVNEPAPTPTPASTHTMASSSQPTYEPAPTPTPASTHTMASSSQPTYEAAVHGQPAYQQPAYEAPVNYASPMSHTQPMMQPSVEVQKANFAPLGTEHVRKSHDNIDLILDVALDISVVLGRTKKSIRDILNLGNGSLIELNRLADEPVEVLVNGKVIAEGEVVVIDENFGVRINNIVSGADRIKSLR